MSKERIIAEVLGIISTSAAALKGEGDKILVASALGVAERMLNQLLDGGKDA